MNSQQSPQEYPVQQREIQIFDTTLRDGDQGTGTPFMLGEKILVARKLAQAGISVIEAGFARSRIDMDSIKAVVDSIGKEANSPTIASLSRANKEDIDASQEALTGATKPRIHTFLATSPIHMRDKLNMEPGMVIERINSTVQHAAATGMEVQFSAEDAMNSEKQFLLEAVRTAIEAGASIINIPDTLGGSNPWKTQEVFTFLVNGTYDLRKKGMNFIFSAHAHNDNGLALANTLAAIRSGARQVETTVLGIGERTGNVALHQIVAYLRESGDSLHPEMNFDTKFREMEMFPLSLMVAKILGTPIRSNEPIIGSRTNSHGSWIHTDGAIKWTAVSGIDPYAIIDTSRYGNPGEVKTFNARGGAAEVLEMLGQFIDVEKMSKASLDSVVARCAKIAERSRGIYPSTVYAYYLESIGRFAIKDIETKENHEVRIRLNIDGKEQLLIGRSDGENGIISATVNALNAFIAPDSFDIAEFHAENRVSLAELEEEFFDEKTKDRGSEDIGIVTYKLRTHDGRTIDTRHASRNVDQSSVRALIYAVTDSLMRKSESMQN